MKRYFYQVPNHVLAKEAANLYYFMATLKPIQTRFLDEKHQFIFDELNHLMKIGSIDQERYFVGTRLFINHLKEYNLLDKAGGLSKVQNIFNGLEPEELLEGVC